MHHSVGPERLIIKPTRTTPHVYPGNSFNIPPSLDSISGTTQQIEPHAPGVTRLVWLNPGLAWMCLLIQSTINELIRFSRR